VKFLKDLFTELDNETYSTARILAIAGFCEYLGLAIADFVKNGHFAMQDFGIGLGAVIAAVGMAIKTGEKP
jgi:hypothetical protein